MPFTETENYAEFDFTQLGIKFFEETEYAIIECLGSIEETLNNKRIEKKCGGVVQKTRVYGDGTGTATITGHLPYDVYCKAFAMNQDGFIDGVKAYGQSSVHPEFSLTCDVTNEDGIHKYKAYPRCKVTANLTRKIERGAEEVAELELEMDLYPDENGNCMYEAIEDNLTDDDAKKGWMKSFTPEMIEKSA